MIMLATAIATIGLFAALYMLVLFDMVRFRREIGRYIGYGLVFYLMELVLAAALILRFPALVVEHMPKWVYLALVFGGLLGTVPFVSVGAFSAETLSRPAMPLVRRAFGEDVPLDGFGRRWAFDVCRFVVLAVAYVFLLSRVTGLRVLDRRADLGVALAMFGGEFGRVERALLGFGAILGGELAMRLGLQSFIARQFKLHGRRYLVAVCFTGALWALTDFQALGTGWFGLARLVPVGIGLGLLFGRYGLETSLLGHVTFRVADSLLQEWLRA